MNVGNMALSTLMFRDYVWVEIKQLEEYKQGKIDKLDLYSNKEFCPHPTKQMKTLEAIK